MGKKTWINLINFDAGIFATVGRALSPTKAAKAISYITWPIMFVTVGIVIFLFFHDLGESSNWIPWIIMGLMTFNMFRTACSSTYHAICCNKKATDDTKTAIGALNGNSVTIGIALGNIVSHIVKSLK